MPKYNFNLFDPFEIEDRQTRTSTFSHQSINAREEIKKNNEAFYDAFVKNGQGSFNGFLLRPIDHEEQPILYP